MDARDQARLRRVCAEATGVGAAELDGATDLFEDLNIDGDELEDLIAAIEDEFGITVEDGLAGIRTVDDLEGLVEDLASA
jgi:acyl carrier protein